MVLNLRFAPAGSRNNAGSMAEVFARYDMYATVTEALMTKEPNSGLPIEAEDVLRFWFEELQPEQ